MTTARGPFTNIILMQNMFVFSEDIPDGSKPISTKPDDHDCNDKLEGQLWS